MINREQYFEFVHDYPALFRNPDSDNAGIHIITDETKIEQIEQDMARRLADKGLPREWAQVGVVYQDQYITMLRDAVYFQPGSHPGTYIRNFNKDNVPGIVILPIYNDKVCLIRIYRHALRRYVYEIPRGFGEKGLSEIENALRELREEIGGVIKNITPLGYMSENSGMMGGKAALFLADLKFLNYSVDKTEGIERVHLVSKQTFLTMMRDGEIDDAYTLCAAIRAMLRGCLATS
ncbi:MAG: NUDIX hydrolase [Clostridiales bacterium]|jgi:ADP-ribose pyrophosphatase|nr:NUDIX hydrolase [Clostridiales bacterium]